MFITRLIPRPPPPYAALNITGNPCVSQNFLASSRDSTGPGVPGTTCTPATQNFTLFWLCELFCHNTMIPSRATNKQHALKYIQIHTTQTNDTLQMQDLDHKQFKNLARNVWFNSNVTLRHSLVLSRALEILLLTTLTQFYGQFPRQPGQASTRMKHWILTV